MRPASRMKTASSPLTRCRRQTRSYSQRPSRRSGPSSPQTRSTCISIRWWPLIRTPGPDSRPGVTTRRAAPRTKLQDNPGIHSLVPDLLRSPVGEVVRPILLMRRHLTTGPLLLALVLFCSGATTVFAQSTPPAKPSTPAPPSSSSTAPSSAPDSTPPNTTFSLPVDVNRVKEQAERLPAVKLDEQQLRFYVLIL